MTTNPVVDFISLSRGPCFGTCPVYEVTLRADGTATWHGEDFVERTGDRDGTFDEWDYARLAAFVRRSGFFGWQEEYTEPVTDVPAYVITASDVGYPKSVLQYATDEPQDFWVIAALIDAVAATVTWSPDPASDM